MFAKRLGLVFACLIFAFPACKPSPTNSPANPANDLSFPIGEFSLTERNGTTVTNADLRGKVWIASFVFTRCTGPCKPVTATMARLQSELADRADVRFVTFTVDPSHDNASELRSFASFFRADAKRWLFLTGEEKEIHRLMRDSFKPATARNEKAKDPGEGFDHSTRLVVVDRDGNVRGFFDGIPDPNVEGSDAAFERGLKQLKEKVDALLKTPGQ